MKIVDKYKNICEKCNTEIKELGLKRNDTMAICSKNQNQTANTIIDSTIMAISNPSPNPKAYPWINLPIVSPEIFKQMEGSKYPNTLMYTEKIIEIDLSSFALFL